MFKNKKQESNASARVVDGKLILSLPDARTPVVWQMDLAQSKASALEVREKEDSGETLYTLTLKTPRGETIEVAPFTSRAYAVEGLMAASGALEGAHGQIKTGSDPANDQGASSTHTPHHKKSGAGKKILITLACIAGVLALFMIWGAQVPRLPASTYPAYASPYSQSAAQQTIQQQSPRESSGVAVSADDFLNAR